MPQHLLVLLLLVLGVLCASVDASQHGRHGHVNHQRRSGHADSSHGNVIASRQHQQNKSMSIEDAASLVDRAHKALAVANALRTSYIRFNNYEFKDSASQMHKSAVAPPLDLALADDSPASFSHHSKDFSSGRDFSYSIPEEIIEAARVMAEANPPKLSSTNHSIVADQIRAKYARQANDTNAMPQALLAPSGLLGDVILGDNHAVEIVDRSVVAKRASVDYWMPKMNQNGITPFGPSGYPIWRNVKDFGAVGDGKKDDTVAINLAILAGGRCGENCGSSTIYPAVIWFPPGTYLVSSSIIQYYNTQFLGDPNNMPTILAAPSFVGLGVITSNVYTGNGEEEWYINQNNFLRSIRNFVIDVRQAPPNTEVAGIHWQVAQGTSLENIIFYMSFEEGNNQQGIFMENGSGGFLSGLTFVGGKFGAYFGNQQFTTSHLIFISCQTALQIHWDWAWTMQDVVIESCQQGIKILSKGGDGTTQGVGSIILVDAAISNTDMGIETSLLAENSTSLLLQNVGFFNVRVAVQDTVASRALLPGGAEVLKENWGFGMISDASGNGSFANGQDIPAMNRSATLTAADTAYATSNNLFTRRRPRYDNIGASQILNIKDLGAKGDGVTDDTVALNTIFEIAANISSVVFIPFGVYIVTDTVKVPVGSRIVGQAWSQIMAKGSKFADMAKPHVAVQVGNVGDVGVVEIQDMMFTATGPTAGVVLLEWNVHESSQGSAGLWDSHFRIGGAIGSDLQKDDCPKLTGSVSPKCIAASLLFRITKSASAYIENSWMWVADHDLDIVTQDQIDIYSARGILIESQGPTWLYGTSSEHNVLYQYQLSGAKDVLMGMIQTESPYYQVGPPAPAPFEKGLNKFPNDPTFSDCAAGDLKCAVSWALRVIDSSGVYILGAGVYSWFSKYSQDCLKTESCQSRAVEMEESHDIWLYNLCTKAVVEMVSPLKETPTYAKDNVNGFLSSILAWLGGAKNTTGQRDFEGFQLYTLPQLDDMSGITDICKTALSRTIKCHKYLQAFKMPAMRGSLEPGLMEPVCDEGCERSLKLWFDTVSLSCADFKMGSALPTTVGGTIWAGWNQTCSRDSSTGEYCGDIINGFTVVSDITAMPEAELCSECYLARLQMLQSSPYTIYNEKYKRDLEYAQRTCAVTGPTDILPRPYVLERDPDPICATGSTYITQEGDTCDSISLAHNVASAALVMGNDEIARCDSFPAGIELCLPVTCPEQYQLMANDTCRSIERAHRLSRGSLRHYNSWLDYSCRNLQGVDDSYGSILCLGPQGGEFTGTAPVPGVTVAPGPSSGYSKEVIPPTAGAVVAEGTTMNCGKWWEAEEGQTCAMICLAARITSGLFLEVNPSLVSTEQDCSDSLVVGKTYCVGPIYGWDAPTPTNTAAPSP